MLCAVSQSTQYASAAQPREEDALLLSAPLHFTPARLQGRLEDALRAALTANTAAVSTSAAPTKLETYIDKFVTHAPTFHRGAVQRCNCRLCPDCCSRWGANVRKRMQAVASDFQAPALLSITISRGWHASPEAAYDYVMRNRFLPRLLTKELGIRRWLSVMEPQTDSGEGWPHWHILIDKSPLPGRWYNGDQKASSKARPADITGWTYIPRFLDLGRIHRLLRKWKVGEQFMLSEKRDSFASPLHAVNYITKYLVEAPKRGVPAWMLQKPGVRIAAASRALGPVLTSSQRKAEKPTAAGNQRMPRHRKPNRAPVERIAECRKKMAFYSTSSTDSSTISAMPFLATASSLKGFDGATSKDCVSLATGKAYTAWGFNDERQLSGFMDHWHPGSRAHQALQAEIEKRRDELLRQWSGDAGQTGANQAEQQPNQAKCPTNKG